MRLRPISCAIFTQEVDTFMSSFLFELKESLKLDIEAWMKFHEEKQRDFTTQKFLEYMNERIDSFFQEPIRREVNNTMTTQDKIARLHELRAKSDRSAQENEELTNLENTVGGQETLEPAQPAESATPEAPVSEGEGSEISKEEVSETEESEAQDEAEEEESNDESDEDSEEESDEDKEPDTDNGQDQEV